MFKKLSDMTPNELKTELKEYEHKVNCLYSYHSSCESKYLDTIYNEIDRRQIGITDFCADNFYK